MQTVHFVLNQFSMEERTERELKLLLEEYFVMLPEKWLKVQYRDKKNRSNVLKPTGIICCDSKSPSKRDESLSNWMRHWRSTAARALTADPAVIPLHPPPHAALMSSNPAFSPYHSIYTACNIAGIAMSDLIQSSIALIYKDIRPKHWH